MFVRRPQTCRSSRPSAYTAFLAMPSPEEQYEAAYSHPAEPQGVPRRRVGDGPGDPAPVVPSPPAPVDPTTPPTALPPDPGVPSRDRQQDLFAHLAELRFRVLASCASVVVMMTVSWGFGSWIIDFLSRPLRKSLEAYHGEASLVTHNPTEGFMIYFQVVLLAGTILAMPFVLAQMWLFVEPALTHRERRFTLVLVPFSIILFVAGAVMAYFCAPLFFAWFMSYQPAGTRAYWGLADSVIFFGKILLAFGICFQVPVVTIFLNKIGLISRNWMIEYWRHVVVGIFVVVAIVTPTWDPFTLTICAIPPCLLYGLSIWIVKWI